MIKINLAKNLNFDAATSRGDLGLDPDLRVDTEVDQKVGLRNLVIILLGPLGIYLYYNQIKIPELMLAASQLNSQISQLESENQQTEAVAQEIKSLNAQIEDIKNRKETIQNLSLDRTLTVKVFDVVQTLIPEKVWLDRVSLAQGRMIAQGYATSDGFISSFMSALEGSIYFDSVNLVSAEERKFSGGTAKFFEIKSNVAKKGGASEN